MLKFKGLRLWPHSKKFIVFCAFLSLVLLNCLIFRPPVWALGPEKWRWAADIESGAPFSFYDPENLSVLTGFEVEILNDLAKLAGVNTEFVQNSWEGLVPGLGRGDYELAINGLEITPERQKEVFFSQPYFVSYEQVVVRRESPFQGIHDLAGKKVGTLKSSLAHNILEKQFPQIQIVLYENESYSFEDLKIGRLDAVFIDHPIALYYAQPRAEFKLVGEGIGEMFYGIALSKKRPDLLQKVNSALDALILSGRLQAILQNWHLWSPQMAQYLSQQQARLTRKGLKTPEAAPALQKENAAPRAYEKFVRLNYRPKNHWAERIERYFTYTPLLLRAALTSLLLAMGGMLLAVFWGLCLQSISYLGPRWLYYLVRLKIELIRGTPLLIQLFLIFYGLPYWGIELSPWLAAILGLGLNYAANTAENLRGALSSIPAAQEEAAFCLGLNSRQIFFRVLLPQAWRVALPSMTNDFVALIKDSSLVSVITMVELTKVYGQLASASFDYLGLGIIVAAIYLLLGMPWVRLSRYLEKSL